KIAGEIALRLASAPRKIARAGAIEFRPFLLARDASVTAVGADRPQYRAGLERAIRPAFEDDLAQELEVLEKDPAVPVRLRARAKLGPRRAGREEQAPT